MNLQTSCFAFFTSFQFFMTLSFGLQEFGIKVNSSVLLRDKERGVGFTAFKKHEHRYLNVTPMSVIFSNTVRECALLTAMYLSAFSFNFAVHPSVHGLHRCELLNTDLFNNTDKLVNNTAFNHYSIGSPCAENPCQNGGSCVAKYSSDEYNCTCHNGFMGRNCEKAEIIIPKACKPEWIEWKGACYKVFTTGMTWANALSACRTQGSNLTSVTSPEETNFLLSLLSGTVTDEYVWIGLNDIAKEGAHEWVDRNQSNFINWELSQPNDINAQENCVDFEVRNGKWYDFECHELEGCVCKYVL